MADWPPPGGVGNPRLGKTVGAEKPHDARLQALQADTSGDGWSNEDRKAVASIAASLRAHIERLAISGATGIPRGTPRASARSSARASKPVQAAPEASGSVAVSAHPTAVEGSAPLTLEGRLERLTMLASEVRACTRCPLCRHRTQTVFARGNPSSELCFVGEGPGANEDAQGEPFVGEAGQLLDRMIAAMGFGRDEVYICNIVKCRPPENRKPEPAEMRACAPFLAEQLRLVSPKVIVALGTTAVEGLLGAEGGITRLRGHWRLYRGATPVMPTFHPAYLLRSPAAKRDVWLDLQAVLKHMGRRPPST